MERLETDIWQNGDGESGRGEEISISILPGSSNTMGLEGRRIPNGTVGRRWREETNTADLPLTGDDGRDEPTRRRIRGLEDRGPPPSCLRLIMAYIIVCSLLGGLGVYLFQTNGMAPTDDGRPCPFTDNYLLYLPHGSLHAQRVELANALVLSSLLGRTLVLPPAIVPPSTNYPGADIPYAPYDRLSKRISDVANNRFSLRHCRQVRDLDRDDGMLPHCVVPKDAIAALSSEVTKPISNGALASKLDTSPIRLLTSWSHLTTLDVAVQLLNVSVVTGSQLSDRHPTIQGLQFGGYDGSVRPWARCARWFKDSHETEFAFVEDGVDLGVTSIGSLGIQYIRNILRPPAKSVSASFPTSALPFLFLGSLSSPSRLILRPHNKLLWNRVFAALTSPVPRIMSSADSVMAALGGHGGYISLQLHIGSREGGYAADPDAVVQDVVAALASTVSVALRDELRNVTDTWQRLRVCTIARVQAILVHTDLYRSARTDTRLGTLFDLAPCAVEMLDFIRTPASSPQGPKPLASLSDGEVPFVDSTGWFFLPLIEEAVARTSMARWEWRDGNMHQLG
ncbi:hypothetical protein HDU93_003508 [Gonapodya sp. JEL0774]|nr:hypothetical protein HDU93_003508 [Gonapodya sp. JEL0774]